MTPANELPSISVETARSLLRHVMEWDSEESTCASWDSGNEYRLWCQVIRDPVVAGEILDGPQYTWLRELAAAAGGWWVWPRETPPQGGPAFLRMSDWLPIYDAHRQTIIETHGPKGSEAGRPPARQEDHAPSKELREKNGPRVRETKAEGVARATATAQLLRLMEDESEDNWAMGWAPDLEYMLWASVVGDDPGEVRGGSADPARLKKLADLANGWFARPEEADEVGFVPMDRWLVMYRQYVEAQRIRAEGEGSQP